MRCVLKAMKVFLHQQSEETRLIFVQLSVGQEFCRFVNFANLDFLKWLIVRKKVFTVFPLQFSEL